MDLVKIAFHGPSSRQVMESRISDLQADIRDRACEDLLAEQTEEARDALDDILTHHQMVNYDARGPLGVTSFAKDIGVFT
ncbi:hypothetical protein AK812_SmicGene36934 [Symbiodinium microadriaticum]|uniref:Uncharacterized protein n=1 Tax=Symbiodinium microadriaticum TaxID=2951 RepID=A0A1Q9CHK3_SYMMI|nr:hypothetical protein AK812_SmicGene36934 [Symbiodinium microadriaticum]